MGAGTGLGERVVEGKHSSGHLDKISPAPGRTLDTPARPPRRAPNTLPWEKGVLSLCSTFNLSLLGKFWICKKVLPCCHTPR